MASATFVFLVLIKVLHFCLTFKLLLWCRPQMCHEYRMQKAHLEYTACRCFILTTFNTHKKIGNGKNKLFSRRQIIRSEMAFPGLQIMEKASQFKKKSTL